MKTPKRLPSAREFALLAWDARLEVLSTLRAIELAYLETEQIRGNDESGRAGNFAQRVAVSD